MPTRRTCFAALRSRRCGPLCRSDDNASVKPKMLYASSKDALKKALTGINDEYQATESASWLIRLAGSSRAHGTTATRAALQLRASARAEPRAPRAPDAGGHAPSLGGQHPAAACVPAGRWWPLPPFVLAQWPEHTLSATRRGDLDFKEIQKKAGGGK